MLTVTGTEQLRKLAADLAAAGDGGRRFRARLRRNVVAATAPIEQEARQGWSGYGALGADLSAAVGTRVQSSTRVVGVSVRIRGSRMPQGKESLPPLTEGLRAWRHPLFGNKEHWYSQAARPELGPAVKRDLPHVQAGVIAAVEETAAALEGGSA